MADRNAAAEGSEKSCRAHSCAGGPLPQRGTILAPEFFAAPAARVARGLLGKALVRRCAGRSRSFMVVETEAYLGEHDLAAHSSRGRTLRTEVMFGPAARFYVYRIYGLYWMLNVVAGRPGEAAAVLIRGLDGISGPGRVAAALEIDGSFNGQMAARRSGLWFADVGFLPPAREVHRTPRIGVDYAGPIWANKKLRFVLAGARQRRR